MKLYDLSETKLRDYLHSDLADVSTDGTGLYSQTTKIALNDSLYTLIIGIGGTGWRALARIKKYMLDNVREYGQNTAFLAIDADTDELDKSILDQNREMIAVSARASESDRQLNIPENRDEKVREWINPGYHVRHDDKGANRIRQAGRGKLYTRNNNGRFNDVEVIDKIAAAQRRLGRINQVILVAGLSGGSGSGMLIDIAMLTKIALSDAKIEAFCFLPDTMEDICDSSERNSLYANGYAALKEIDYFVGVSQRKGFADEFTSTDGRRVTFDVNHALFDSVTLIDGSSTRQNYRNANAKAMDVFVESVVNMLAAGNRIENDTGDIQDQNNQAVLSFLSNQSTERRNMLENQGRQQSGLETAGWFLEDNFCYSGIGVASASIPQKICTSYIVRSVMRNIFSMKDQDFAQMASSINAALPTLQENEARAAISSIIGDGTNLFSFQDINNEISNKVDKKVVTPEDMDEAVREDFLSNSSSIREYYKYSQLHDEIESDVDKAIDKKFEKFRQKAMEFVKNNGPRALVALYEGKTVENGKPVPFKEQKSMQSIILEKLPSSIDDKRKKANADYTKEINHRILGFNAMNINRAKRYLTEVIKAEIEYDVRNHVFGRTASKNAIQQRYIDKVEGFIDDCRSFDTILTALLDIYSNFAVSFDNPESFRNASDNSANVNIISSESAYIWAKDKLDSVIKMINPKDAMSDIVDDYFSEEHGDDWRLKESLSGNKLNARVRFEQIIAERIRKANNNRNVVLTINEYIENCLKEGNQSIDNIIGTIADSLRENSDTLFKKAPEFQSIYSPTHICVIFPRSVSGGANGAAIRNAFRLAFGDSANFYTSDITDKIVLYKLEACNPLYSLAELPKWENAYENSGLTMIHMNESGRGDFDPEIGLEWKNYPSCRCNVDARNLPESRRNSSLEYRFLTNEFDSNFDKALEYGIIREDKNADGSSYYFYDISNDGWNFDIPDYDVIDSFGMPVGGAQLIDYIRRRNGAADPLRVELFRNGVFTEPHAENGQYPVGEAKRRAKRVLRRNVKMYVAMKKSILKYEERFNDISANSNEKKLAQTFTMLVGTGYIVRNNEKSGTFELTIDGKTTSLLVPTKLNKISWPVDLLKLYDSGFEYAAAFRRFREIYSSSDQLNTLFGVANKAWVDETTRDSGENIVSERLGEFGEEAKRFNQEYSEGADKLLEKLGISRERFELTGIENLYGYIASILY